MIKARLKKDAFYMDSSSKSVYNNLYDYFLFLISNEA